MRTHPLDTLRERMAEFTRRQYAANIDHRLDELAEFNGVGYSIHPDLLAFLLAEREGVLLVLDQELKQPGLALAGTLLDQFVTTTEAFIYQNNQFIHLEADDRARLTDLYRAYIADFQTFLLRNLELEEAREGFQEVFERHFLALGGFVQSLGSRLGEALITTQVVNAEYPVALQLDLLGLKPGSLVEPVLDIGCGRHAALVERLRQTGLEAYGLDLMAEPSAAVFRTGWLDFDFGQQRWGTIVSHLAFSNHFLFHHLYARGAPETYARKYMEILSSLIVGGQLFYTPGLPFMEGLLPAIRFQVQMRRVALPASMRAAMETTYARLLGQTPVYTTRITRLR